MNGVTDMRLAVLIDADNVVRSDMKAIIGEVTKYGTPVVKRAYGDWASQTLAGWKDVLLEIGAVPVQQYAYTTGKNATDVAMVIDAMDFLHDDCVEGFVLVSSDSDFTPLALRLRESGKRVFGIGEKKTPKPFIKACDKFIYAEILRPSPEVAPVQKVESSTMKTSADIKPIETVSSTVGHGAAVMGVPSGDKGSKKPSSAATVPAKKPVSAKTVEFIADETELCQISFKANFKTLGKKCGAKMKAVAAAIASAKTLPTEAEGVALDPEDVIVTRSSKPGLVVASQGAIVVGLETALTPELIAEGNAREFVSHVQSMRKEADFEVTQRIAVTVKADAEMKAALEAHLDYVKNETLATDVTIAEGAGDVDLNGHKTAIAVKAI